MAVHTVTYGIEGSGIRRLKEISNTQAGISLIDGETVATAETAALTDGPSFSPVIVTVTVAVEVPPSPSVTV